MNAKRHLSKISLNRRVVLLSLSLLILSVTIFLSWNINPAGGVGITAYSGSEYTLADFPEPFIMENSSNINTFILIPNSNPHGPCGSAHTMDTMGGVLIAYTLGVKKVENGGSINLKTAMDSYIHIRV